MTTVQQARAAWREAMDATTKGVKHGYGEEGMAALWAAESAAFERLRDLGGFEVDEAAG